MFDGIELSTFHPKAGDVIIAKVNLEMFDYQVSNEMYKILTSAFPKNTVVMIPSNMDLEKIR